MKHYINFIPIQSDATGDAFSVVAPRTLPQFAHYDRMYAYQHFNGVPFVPPRRKMNVVTHHKTEHVQHVAKMTPQQRGALAGNQKAEMMRTSVRPTATAVCVCGSKCISVGGCVDTCRISALT